jgi:hypothetical protein
MRVISLIAVASALLSLSGTSHAFLPQLPPTRPIATVTRSSNNKLHVMDPSHIWETASSLMISEDAAVGEVSYSKASYYTVLALYIMSFPGLWSQIKRSTTAKVKRKTYVSPGENSNNGGKDLRQQAGEIMACKKKVCCFVVLCVFCS